MDQNKDGILLGCVADDFTGASDAASFLVKEGIKTLLFNGVPKNEETVKGCRAVVIALKTRNMDSAEAVRDTRAAFEWLRQRGTKQFYMKYCSTFDSTKQGNIGPTIDSTLEDSREKFTVICPSLPVNRRIVKDGRLYVDGIPLDESHMKNHPLNPMWDSDIAKLMEPQGKYGCLKITRELLEKPAEEIARYVEDFAKGQEHFYVIPDYETEEDGRKIVEVFGGLKLFTGGSGLLAHLGAMYRKKYPTAENDISKNGTPGRGIVLSGSCSKATREQIQEFKDAGGKAYAVSPSLLLSGEQNIQDIWNFVTENSQSEVLVYSAGAENTGQRAQEREEDKAKASALLEEAMAEVGRRAFENGYTRIIVAGGETSGAVTLALGFDAFIIGESIAPGVPIMMPVNSQHMRLVLKSGNFGQKDFFSRALDMTRG